MATVERLGIIGVRSFSPDTMEVLPCDKPLTLIVGHNGAGKTTIVECLKMVCTGQMPPCCDQGKNFVHSPEIADRVEVKGQIRVVFNNVCSSQLKKFSVARSFKVTQAKTKDGVVKPNYKALDSVIETVGKDGEKAAMSKKCGDIDAMVPRMLGVSKAVLENVIFCHQEDSSWPLQDMSRLKKKFDDLFGSSRYTKALEVITQLRKEKAKEEKQSTHEAELLKQKIEQTREIKRNVQQCELKRMALQDKLSEMTVKQTNREKSLQQSKTNFDKVQLLETDFQVKRRLLASKEREVQSIKGSLSEQYVETEEELQQCAEDLQQQINALQIELKQEEKVLDDLHNDMRRITTKKEQLQSEAKEAYKAEERLTTALRRSEKASVVFKEKFGDCTAAEGSILPSDELWRCVENGTTALESKKGKAAFDVDELEKLLQKLQSDFTELKGAQRAKQCEEQRLTIRLTDLQNKVQESSSMKAQLTALEKDVGELEGGLSSGEASKSVTTTSSEDDRLKSLRAEQSMNTTHLNELQAVQSDFESLDELSKMTKQHAFVANIAKDQLARQLIPDGPSAEWEVLCNTTGTYIMHDIEEYYNDDDSQLTTTELLMSPNGSTGRHTVSGMGLMSTGSNAVGLRPLSSTPSARGGGAGWWSALRARLSTLKRGLLEAKIDSSSNGRGDDQHCSDSQSCSTDDDSIQAVFESVLGMFRGGATVGAGSSGRDVVAVVKRNAAIFAAIADKAQQEVDSSNRRVGVLEGELQTLERQSGAARSEFAAISRELTHCGVVSLEDYPVQLEQLQSKLNEANDKLQQTKSARLWVKNYLNHSVRSNKCSFCTRTFTEQCEVDIMRSALEALLAKIPAKLTAHMGAVASAKENFMKLEDMKTKHMTVELLQQKLKANDSRIEALVEEIGNFTAVAADAKSDIEIATQRVAACKDILGQLEVAVPMLAALENKMKVYEGARSKLCGQSLKLSSNSKLKIVSLNDCWTKIKESREKMSTMDDQILMIMQTREDRRAKEATFMADMSAKRNEIVLVQMELRQVEDFKVEITSTSELLQKLVAEKPRLNSEIERLSSQVDQAKSELQRKHQVVISLSASLKSVTDDGRRIVNELTEAGIDIQRGQQAKNAHKTFNAQLNTASEELTEIMSSVTKNKSEMNKKRDEFEEHNKWLGEVNKSINLRKSEKVLEQLQEELKVMRIEAGGIDPASLKELMETAQRSLEEVNREIAHTRGSMDSNIEWQRQLKASLNAPKFLHVTDEYKESIEVMQVLQMAVKDLKTYHDALSKAVMKYHDLKMQEINRSLKELWQAIYKGADIDYIGIRLDNEEDQKKATTTMGQRSYNYRVVMIRDDVELEMRGRCSAGQKVLACIVVRLVLAECFSFNCGVLALDEPTTNLDTENIEGLASALCDLIELRKNNSNFQLLLITHDEEFVRMLAKNGHCNHYFKVAKSVHGHSTITRADIRTF